MSDFGVYQNPLEDLLKHKFLVKTQIVKILSGFLIQKVWGTVPECAFLTKFPGAAGAAGLGTTL